jgi:hypothetical protein
MTLDKSSWNLNFKFKSKKQLKKFMGFNLVSLVLEDSKEKQQSYLMNIYVHDKPVPMEVKKVLLPDVKKVVLDKKLFVVEAYITEIDTVGKTTIKFNTEMKTELV